MRDLLGEVKLRNPRRVFRERWGFIVESTDPRGKRYLEEVTAEIVDALHDALRGQTVSRIQAGAALRSLKGYSVPYYGRKLDYFAQEVLVVLAALGKATIEKQGRAFIYHVAP